MEKSILIIALCFAALTPMNIYSQETDQRTFEMTEGDTTYTMKRYVFCLYLSGTERSQTEQEMQEIQRAHLNHISSMAETHRLQLVGPLESESEKRGILIFDLATIDEAEAALKADPAVQANRLEFECHYWWAAKGSQLQ